MPKEEKATPVSSATRAAIETSVVRINPPNMRRATFGIRGTAPLVIHRMSAKLKKQLRQKMELGQAAAGKKDRTPRDIDALFEEARYISPEGWDGFHAAALRNAAISACRLVGFHMTKMKLSFFVEPDGWDATEPQIPLVAITGDPVKQEDIGRVETGQPYVIVRAAYHKWSARPCIRWDADQFTPDDVANLLYRVGAQVGIGEGRPDSKDSAGMGWGLFELEGMEVEESAK